MLTTANIVAALLLLIPYLFVAFFSRTATERVGKWPLWLRLGTPGTLCVPYVLVTVAAGDFRWYWFMLYACLPVLITVLLWHASRIDPPGQESEKSTQRGTAYDFIVLAAIGLAVDLRWFERAWSARLSIFNKVTLLDAGIYAFVLVRQLGGSGFDLRLRLRDIAIGLREWAIYTPIALALGLYLGFLHVHAGWPGSGAIAQAWVFTFFFIAVPEELFFRGWLQNLVEMRLGRHAALAITAVLFGLAHFNKRTTNFNWQYVLLAALAGVFYGRAWRTDRRVAASAVTHASVDAIWSLWLR
jgi:membrane protease YdiL (CAAX protease family)